MIPAAPERRALFWVIWTAALLVKLYIAAETPGTSDVQFWGNHGALLAHNGLAAAYRSSTMYNPTPLMAGYAALLATLFGPGTVIFGFWLRLPGIIAEALLAVALWRRGRRTGTPRYWVVLVFVLNPVSLAVTAYHGNVDGLSAALLVAALLAAADNRAVACGVWIGLAVTVKVPALLPGPAFLLWWAARGRARAFVTTAAAVVLAGLGPALWACPREFAERVLGYNGIWGVWGISRLLYVTGWDAFHSITYSAPSLTARILATALKATVIAWACLLAWRRRKMDAAGLMGTVAASWVVFLVLAPAGATQYLIWPLLPLLLHHARIGTAYILAATPAMIFYYTPLVVFLLPWNPLPALIALFPWLDGPEGWCWPGLFLWLVLVIIALRELPRWWKPGSAALGLRE